MKFGLEVLLQNKELQKSYQDKKIGWLCHAASVNQNLQHSLDLVKQNASLNISCAFGPQHGILAEKQDNMIESDNFMHPKYKIPVFSLYGEVRRPTQQMFEHLDVLFIDLQDVGCRIYTFLTTLFYCMEAASEWGKKIVVLDRPNPAGREIEGNILDMKWESFVGAAPIPMRHGWTLGEAGSWFKDFKKLNLEYEVIKMEGYKPGSFGAFDWPKEYSWVNPSPNIPRISCTQVYPGSVLIEGTLLSEGRGTTLPLEMFGVPGVDPQKVVAKILELYPEADAACILRPCYFEPTFHKHKGEVCGGLQIHVDHPKYQASKFKPYRIIATYFKALNLLYPDLELWRQPPYEYEYEKLPIDLLSGNDFLRKWVEDTSANFSDLDNYLSKDETEWRKSYSHHFLY